MSNTLQAQPDVFFNADRSLKVTVERQVFELPQVFFKKTGFPFCLYDSDDFYFKKFFGSEGLDPSRKDLRRLQLEAKAQGGYVYKLMHHLDADAYWLQDAFAQPDVPDDTLGLWIDSAGSVTEKAFGFVIVTPKLWRKTFPLTPFTRVSVERILQHRVFGPLTVDAYGPDSALICTVFNNKNEVLYYNDLFCWLDAPKLWKRFPSVLYKQSKRTGRLHRVADRRYGTCCEGNQLGSPRDFGRWCEWDVSRPSSAYQVDNYPEPMYL